VDEPVTRFGLDLQQLVQLGMDRLRVPVLRSLYEQGHAPGCKYGKSMPAKVAAIEDDP
jgi:hypothetical protein